MGNLTHQSKCDTCRKGNGEGDEESLRLHLHRENNFFKTSNELIAEVLKEQGQDMAGYICKNAVCTVNYEEHFVQNHQIHKTIKT